MFRIVKHPVAGICPAHGCKNPVAPKKRFCHKHHARFQKENNPVGYTFNLLRQNAKRRGHEFTLTMEEFRGFCEKHDYIEKKGRHKRGLSIDRIDPRKGYSLDNIQPMTLSANCKKQHTDKDLYYSDCPF